MCNTGVYAWLILSCRKEGLSPDRWEWNIGCLVSCNEQGETEGVCFPKRMRIISTLLSLRGHNLGEIGRNGVKSAVDCYCVVWYGGFMSRPLRIQYPDAWYHVMNRGRRGESVFRKNEIISTLLSLRGHNLEEIGREFNIAHFSSVSSGVERMRGEISGDGQLRNCVEGIKIVLQMRQA